MKTSRARATAYVAFGSNLGRSRITVERAMRALAAADGIQLEDVSPLYRSDPVGGPKQGPFLNGVARLSARCTPQALMTLLLNIENRLGRRRSVRWGPRVIDLDLLSFGRRRLNTRALTLPHPRYHERRFVLAPLCDIAPRARHIGLNLAHRTLLARLPAGEQRVTMVGTWKKSRFHLFSKKRKRANPSSR